MMNRDDNDTGKKWKCVDCPVFSTDSEAEFLYHKIVIHKEGVDKNPEQPSTSQGRLKYRCSQCNKYFSKLSLRSHLRKHTGERPYTCNVCSRTFTRKSSLKPHIKTCMKPKPQRGKVEKKKPIRERKFICDECNGAFHSK